MEPGTTQPRTSGAGQAHASGEADRRCIENTCGLVDLPAGTRFHNCIASWPRPAGHLCSGFPLRSPERRMAPDVGAIRFVADRGMGQRTRFSLSNGL